MERLHPGMPNGWLPQRLAHPPSLAGIGAYLLPRDSNTTLTYLRFTRAGALSLRRAPLGLTRTHVLSVSLTEKLVTYSHPLPVTA